MWNDSIELKIEKKMKIKSMFINNKNKFICQEEIRMFQD